MRIPVGSGHRVAELWISVGLAEALTRLADPARDTQAGSTRGCSRGTPLGVVFKGSTPRVDAMVAAVLLASDWVRELGRLAPARSRPIWRLNM